MKSATILAVALAPLLLWGCGGGDGGAEDMPAAGEEAAGEAAPADMEAEAAETGGAEASGNWIEYTITGDVEASGREMDIMICSTTEDGRFLARSLGDWVIDIEVDEGAAGEYTASVSVAAPTELVEPGSDPGEWRFRGTGPVTIRDTGQDALTMRTVAVDYSGSDLANDRDQSLSVSGSFACSVM